MDFLAGCLAVFMWFIVIQIGFHAALNNRGYSSSPLIPIARSGNSEQTRRLADSNNYLLSRGLSASNEMPEPEYDSFEDYSFRSDQPVQYPYQRRNDDLRYRSENDVSLKTAPVGRINSNNYTESIQSSPSSSRRTCPNYRRQYSARGSTYLEQGQTRKKNDDSSFDVPFLEDASREEAYSLLSLIEKSFNRRGQNRKYYRKDNSLAADAFPRRRFNRKSNGNSRSSLLDQSFPDDDNTGKLTFLRLSSLDDLNLESSLLKSQDQNELNNRKSNSRNFLRLSLSPNNKLTHDEGIASDFSELLSETLKELNLVPVSLRRTGPSSSKYSRRDNRLSAEEDDLTNPSDLRLGSLDIQDSELPTRKYKESEYRSKNNLRRHGNDRAALKTQFDEDTAKTLVPYHEGNRKKLHNSRRNGNKNNNRKDDFSDEFSLDTYTKEGHDDSLNLDDNLSSDLSVLRSTNQDNLSLQSSLLRSSNENESKTTDLLNLEYPWTDVLSPTKNKTSGLRSLTQLRNGEQDDKTKDSSDAFHLDFPWNDILSPGSNKSGKSKSNLKRPKQKKNKKDTTDVLHLRYPWNGQLNPDNNKSKQLRSHDQEDNVKVTTDTLRLEFPWNDDLSSDKNKTGKSKSLRRQTDSRQDKGPKDEMKLDQLPKKNQDKPSSKKTAVRIPDPFYVHPFLRNRNIKRHPNYFRRSYDNFSEGVRVENHKNSPLKRSNSLSRRSNRRLMDSQNLRVLPIKQDARAGPENHKNFFKDSDSIESPRAVITFPSDRTHRRLRVRIGRQNDETPPVVTTTEIPNNTDS